MEFSLKARDGAYIYYTLHQASTKKSNHLVILGHGLTGHRFEYIHQIADPIMLDAGYDVIRIAYYTDPKDARKLDDCTVQTHANDLNDLIAFVKNDYKKIFYAGHSYGGLTALLANPNVNATAFWDSTYVPDFWDECASYIPELDCYKIGWGVNALVSKAMVEEAKYLNHDRMKEKALAYKSPSLVVFAGANTDVSEQREKLFEDLNVEKQHVTIENATHCFLEKGVSEALAKQTINWFNKFL